MEQKIKTLLGEYAFTITALQHQVEQLKEKIKEYEDKPQRKKTD
jgi:FtsZ-binding cell division protein ZapB